MKIGMSSAKDSDVTERIWTEDPMVLMSLNMGGQSLFPSIYQSSIERLNSATRLVICMSIFFALFVSGTRRLFTLFVCVLTMISIIVLSWSGMGKESFASSSASMHTGVTKEYVELAPVDSESTGSYEQNGWRPPTESNPYGNLLPGDDFNRLPAPPAYIPSVRADIVEKYKRGYGISEACKESVTGCSDGDVSVALSLNQSERTHYSNPSTTSVPGEGLLGLMGDPGKWKSFAYSP